MTSFLIIGQFTRGRLVVASQGITADVAKVGAQFQFSCTYRRTLQVTLNACPAESPTSVEGICLPRPVEVVPLARTDCQRIYKADLADVENGSTGGPRGGCRVATAELGVTGVRVGGDGS